MKNLAKQIVSLAVAATAVGLGACSQTIKHGQYTYREAFGIMGGHAITEKRGRTVAITHMPSPVTAIAAAAVNGVVGAAITAGAARSVGAAGSAIAIANSGSSASAGAGVSIGH